MSGCSRLLAVTFLVGMLAIAGRTHAQDQNYITIGTGGVTGIYYPAGQAICRSINKTRSEHGLRCAAETGHGAIGNLKDLRSGKIDFAIVQADWQHHAFVGTSAFRENGSWDGLRTVLELHTEAATIVVPDGSDIRTLTDLKNRRMNIGPVGSGSAATWELISGYLGWPAEPEENFIRHEMSELSDALCSGSIEAYFVVIGHPAGVLEETMDKCKVRLLGVGGDLAAVLRKDSPYYVETVIPAGTYGTHNAVHTFGTPAVLATTAKMPETVVETLVRAVDTDLEAFQLTHPALGHLSSTQFASSVSIAPYHPGALNYYRKQGHLP